MSLSIRRVRQLARQYAAEQLRSQDMPDWPVDHGFFTFDDKPECDEFMEELQRIAHRIHRREV